MKHKKKGLKTADWLVSTYVIKCQLKKNLFLSPRMEPKKHIDYHNDCMALGKAATGNNLGLHSNVSICPLW